MSNGIMNPERMISPEGPGPKPQKATQVQLAMSRLVGEVEVMEEVVTAVSERLESVLLKESPGSPEPDPEANCTETVILVQKIDVVIGQIHRTTKFLADIKSRIEL